MVIDLFVNPWAGSYKNRWYWDHLLNKLETIPSVPPGITKLLRGKTREEDYLFERAHRRADRYGRIMRNQGFSHVTVTLPEFRMALAQSIREHPHEPKIVCSGDGGVKEALTTALNYVDRHNALETRVAESLNRMMLAPGGTLNEEIQDFLGGLPLPDRATTSGLTPLARTVLRQKEVGFDFLNGNFRLTAAEKRFIEEYKLKLPDLLSGQVSYPRFGFIRGGTFNVFAHQFRLDPDIKYLEETLRQMEQGEVCCDSFRPLEVEYKDTNGLERKIYGSIYGHGAIRGFFDSYYGGKMRPGPLKALWISLLYRHFYPDEYAKMTSSASYSYQVTDSGGNRYEFDQDTTLSVTSVIGRLPFDMRYFHPEEGYMHTGVTSSKVNSLVGKALLSMPFIARIAGYVGITDQCQIQHDFTNATKMVIQAQGSDYVRFMVDGDIMDNGVLYDTREVRLSLGPQLEVLNPTHGARRMEVRKTG